MIRFPLLFLLTLCLTQCAPFPSETSPFLSLSECVPNALAYPLYATPYNFTGAPIRGYENPKVIVSTAMGHALQSVTDDLAPDYQLRVYDSYRPLHAAEAILLWAANPAGKGREEFYPGLTKRQLFKGYLAIRSAHSRGAAVDLTLWDTRRRAELDMGTPIDFMGEKAAHDFSDLTPEQRSNREKLKAVMLKHGFLAYEKEWWHYTLAVEPFPDIYFDFPIR